jgi:hypothetical protein
VKRIPQMASWLQAHSNRSFSASYSFINVCFTAGKANRSLTLSTENDHLHIYSPWSSTVG